MSATLLRVLKAIVLTLLAMPMAAVLSGTVKGILGARRVRRQAARVEAEVRAMDAAYRLHRRGIMEGVCVCCSPHGFDTACPIDHHRLAAMHNKVRMRLARGRLP
jgi:hypothetical protein